MASIEKRGNKYRIRIPVGKDANGKRIFESMIYEPEATTPSRIKKEVEKAALDFESRVKKGLYTDGDKLTFAEYVPIWREQWAVDNLTQSGLESYEDLLKRRALPVLGFLPMGSIRPTHIQSIITDMKKEGRAVKTIKRTLTAINSVMRYAYDMEVIEDNPVNRVRVPKNGIQEGLHFFTAEQTQVFFSILEKACERYSEELSPANPKSMYALHVHGAPFQWRVYYDLAVMGAFRRGELIAIRWSDIDWKEQTLSIKRAFAKTKANGQILKYPKTAAGIRTITLPASSMELLREWYLMQKDLSMRLGSLWEGYRGKQYDENFVFINPEKGSRMGVDSPSRHFRRTIAAYNASCENEADKLPVIRLHDLRHTSATLLLSNGADIETVSHRLGHKQCSVTLNVYGHWMEENDRKASDTLESLLRKKA